MIIVVLAVALLAVGGFSYWKIRSFNLESEKQKEETHHKLYELAILKELGERIGYSLDVQKIIDIITGSLGEFIDYRVVSYMLVEPEKIIFKMHVEKSVSRKFIDEVKSRMLRSIAALLGKEIKESQVEETLSGALLVDELENSVQSYFNIPLVIAGEAVGVLTVAHIEAGLYRDEKINVLYKLTKQASDAVTKLQSVVKTEERKLNAMVESLGDGVVMTDEDYRVVVVNPAILQAVGISKDKKDITIFDFIDHLGGIFDIRGRLEESVKMDKVLIEKEVLLGERFFQIFISPVKNSVSAVDVEKILGGVVIFHDITSEKQAQRMREDFTSMMVHELRSPLDGIKKMAEVLKSKTVASNKKTIMEYMPLIYDASGRMLELVNDLLDVAKLESGKFEVYKEPVDVRELIKSRHDFFKLSAKDSGLELATKISDNVPATINLDSRRISQVMNNFVSNALKFTKAGGKVLIQAFLHTVGKEIEAEAKEAGVMWYESETDKKLQDLPTSLVLAVADSGHGLDKDDIKKLFSKFTQFGAAMKNEKKGTGLGLVVAKGIIEAHGGAIGVTSEKDVGSTFYGTVPLLNKSTEKGNYPEATKPVVG